MRPQRRWGKGAGAPRLAFPTGSTFDGKALLSEIPFTKRLKIFKIVPPGVLVSFAENVPKFSCAGERFVIKIPGA